MTAVVLTDRIEFMRQAYTALFNGRVREFPYDLQEAIVTEVVRDLTGIARHLPEGPEGVKRLQDQLLAATRPN